MRILHIMLALAFLLLMVQNASAKVSVQTANCGIVYTLHFAFVGNGASDAFIQRVKDGISNFWNKDFTCGDCQCKAKIEVDALNLRDRACADAPAGYSCITVIDTAAYHRSWAHKGQWGEDSHETDSGGGEWDTGDDESVLAHESGHYLGLEDEYEDNFEYSVKDRGGNVVSGPHYVRRADYNDAKWEDLQRTAPDGGSADFDTDAAGVLNIHSRPKAGYAGGDSLMYVQGVDAKAEQRHITEICRQAKASCGNECCCGNTKFEPAKGESCDPTANPTGCAMQYVCRQTCVCERAPVICGDGKIEIQRGEKCDINATTPGKGCADGETCTQGCACVAFPKLDPLIDGKPNKTFVAGSGKKLDLQITGVVDILRYLPIVVRPSGDFNLGSNYIFYNNPNLPKKLKDEVAANPGGYVKVKCESKVKCTSGTDWPDKIVTDQKTGSAKIDWSFLWNDKEEEAEHFEIMIGAKGCTENWDCGQWGACTNHVQTRTCTDLNNCGNTWDNPNTRSSTKIETRPCECTENWQCSEWSDCQNSAQTRSCFDWNNCGTQTGKPETSRGCTEQCIESWNCGDWSEWGGWDACGESGSQSRTRTKSCTDTSSCGTTNSRPAVTETETQSCTYTPTHQKPDYTAHESALGERISNLDYNGATVTRDLSASGGAYGYRILGIPSHVTITVCISGSGPLGMVYYPQYPYGFDFTDTAPGCTDIYNKNNWADGVLVHLGDPEPANVNAQITVTKK